jgi:hypothetical protein
VVSASSASIDYCEARHAVNAPQDSHTLAHTFQTITPDDQGRGRVEALQALVSCWKDEPSTRALVEDVVQCSDDGWRCKRAVQLLVTNWRDERTQMLL